MGLRTVAATSDQASEITARSLRARPRPALAKGGAHYPCGRQILTRILADQPALHRAPVRRNAG